MPRGPQTNVLQSRISSVCLWEILLELLRYGRMVYSIAACLFWAKAKDGTEPCRAPMGHGPNGPHTQKIRAGSYRNFAGVSYRICSALSTSRTAGSACRENISLAADSVRASTYCICMQSKATLWVGERRLGSQCSNMHLGVCLL